MARRVIPILVLAALLSGCAAPKVPEQQIVNPPGDLLIEARKWTEEEGRVAACKRVAEELAKFDDSDGMFEQRLMRTNGNKSFSYMDSVARMPVSQRQRTGIYIILGFNQDSGRSPPIIRRAAERLAEKGFRARVLEVPGRKTVSENAVMVRAFLETELPNVDRAMLIGFSKGSADLVEFWLEEAAKLPKQQAIARPESPGAAGIVGRRLAAHEQGGQNDFRSPHPRSGCKRNIPRKLPRHRSERQGWLFL